MKINYVSTISTFYDFNKVIWLSWNENDELFSIFPIKRKEKEKNLFNSFQKMNVISHATVCKLQIHLDSSQKMQYECR